MKKLLSLMLALVLALALFAGCGGLGDEISPGSSSEAGGSNSDGDIHYGNVGDEFSTVFFDFTVLSAELVDAYEGYTAPEGWLLIDSVITVTNTTRYTLPMFNSDFFILWDTDEGTNGDFGPEDTYGLPGVMADEYELPRNEIITEHVLFLVPDTCSDFDICYTEVYDDGTMGNTFCSLFYI